MELKKGLFAMHKGKEYVALYDPFDQEVELLTLDQSEVANGFRPNGRGKWTKTVAVGCIDSLYQYVIVARYDGIEFLAYPTNGKVVLRDTGFENSLELSRLGFVQVDRDEFRKEVAFDELDQLISKKQPFRILHS